MTDRDLEGGVPAGWSSVGMTQPRGTGNRRPLDRSGQDRVPPGEHRPHGVPRYVLLPALLFYGPRGRTFPDNNSTRKLHAETSRSPQGFALFGWDSEF
jgi:hypothetical protein